METTQKASDNQEFNSPILDCLVIYTKLNRQPYSKEALIAGLPIDSDTIEPEIFQRAAARAHLEASFKARSLEDISNLVLPCILTLSNNQACILQNIDIENGLAEIIMPEAGEGTTQIQLEKLQESYLGYAVYLTKKVIHEQKTENLMGFQEGHWFWGTLWSNKSIYIEMC